jgi:hypothetical protein
MDNWTLHTEDLLQYSGYTPEGWYTIQSTQFDDVNQIDYFDLDSWLPLEYDSNNEEWTIIVNPTKKCDHSDIYYFGSAGYPSFFKQFSGLPPHYKVKFQVDMLFRQTWNGESV